MWVFAHNAYLFLLRYTKNKMKRTRNTVQRKAVLDAVRCLPGHPTAADVFVRVRSDYPHLSLATVYRALRALVERGDIAEMRAENVARYDAGSRPHHHIVCRTCGTVTDIPPVLPDAALCHVEQASGYRLDPHPVQFTGICPGCVSKQA